MKQITQIHLEGESLTLKLEIMTIRKYQDLSTLEFLIHILTMPILAGLKILI